MAEIDYLFIHSIANANVQNGVKLNRWVDTKIRLKLN